MAAAKRKQLKLTVSRITSHLPECEGPFPAVAYAGIGTIFHEMIQKLFSRLETDRSFSESIVEALPDPGQITESAQEEAVQPMKDFLYDEVLRHSEPAARFHGLEPSSQLSLWQATETFLNELAAILAAAHHKRNSPTSVLLGRESFLEYPVKFDGISLLITGRYDLLLYDPRSEMPHLIDFKLCGVKRDLASLMQVMLYALMLNKNHGIKPGATVLNLYPRRSPITVGWEQIEVFRNALMTFVHDVASREFPDLFSRPSTTPNPRMPLPDEVGSEPARPDPAERRTPFETPELMDAARNCLDIVKRKLNEFGFETEAFTGPGGPVIVGPSFTLLRIVPGPAVKVSSVSNRAADLRVALAAESPPRITEGPGYVQIEVPRHERATIDFSKLETTEDVRPPGSFILGVDIEGRVHWGDFSKPATCHLLTAGQTGSGKSEFVRQLLCSLALGSDPAELQVAIVDPKMTDYQDFNGSPYLIRPVIDDMDEAVTLLNDLVEQMEERYGLFRKSKVKHLGEYNKLETDKIPRVVVAFDEFADAMADKDLKKAMEASLKRLGAKARAAGIHLLIATQSPRKEVVTGLIKANLPCAVALQVASGTESRIVIDTGGAEYLLGRGDLLVKLGGKLMRLQSPFANSEAVRHVFFERESRARP